jgi:hypothetical protein
MIYPTIDTVLLAAAWTFGGFGIAYGLNYLLFWRHPRPEPPEEPPLFVTVRQGDVEIVHEAAVAGSEKDSLLDVIGSGASTLAARQGR